MVNKKYLRVSGNRYPVIKLGKNYEDIINGLVSLNMKISKDELNTFKEKTNNDKNKSKVVPNIDKTNIDKNLNNINNNKINIIRKIIIRKIIIRKIKIKLIMVK